MAIDVECPNPDCGCRMQFDSVPADGEITCPACGEKIQVAEPEEAAEEVKDTPAIQEEYRRAEEMAEQTVLDLEPVLVAPPVAQPTVAAPAKPAEEADLDEGGEDRPIHQWVGETAASPPDTPTQSRVKRVRELPPVLIVSVFSCTLLIVLIIGKWYIQTGRWAGETPEPPPSPAAPQPKEEGPSPVEGKASVDGWGSDEEIAKKLGKRLEEWEKSRPDPKFVTVKSDGTANFKTIREALMTVESGGVVEIQDSHIYDEGNVGSYNSEDPEERGVNRKRNVTIRVANGKRAGIRWPADMELKNYSNYLLYIGADWKIRNLVFVGHNSKKISAVGSYYGGLDVRGCTFSHLRYGVMRGSNHEETEIRDSVFQDVYGAVLLAASSEMPHVVFHNNLVKNAGSVFVVYQPKDQAGTPDLLAFSVYENIFIEVGDLLRGGALPKRMDLRWNYNCFWKMGGPGAPSSQGQSSEPNVLATHLTGLQKAKKCDEQSITADPLLLKDGRLDANSPCRGKGRNGGDMGVNWSHITAQAGSDPDTGAAPGKGEGPGKASKTSGL
ncbi:MAG: hypothetical protein AB1696_00820 [Planctomycetota bacterium]